MKEMIKKYRGSLISSILVIFVGVLVGFTSTHGKWINVFFVVTHCIFGFGSNQLPSILPDVLIWMLPLLKNVRIFLRLKAAHSSISSKSHVVLDLPVLLMYPVYPKIHHTPLFNI